jgi:ABC-type sugar transport system ATPase subunit
LETGLWPAVSQAGAFAIKMNELLSIKNAQKAFGGAKALSGADFELRRGEVHALFGSNGAGKSTLARIISGHIRKDLGDLKIHGKQVELSSPRDALRHGIAIVTQETSLVPDLSAFENIILPLYGEKGRIDRRAIRKRADSALEQLGLTGSIDLEQPVRQVSAAKRQMLEIVRALALNAEIIILDEPTTALSPHEVGKLFDAVDQLRKAGKGLIFVSHRLEELFALTDRITVLRDGVTVANGVLTAGLTQNELIKLMVGRDVSALQRSTDQRDFSGAPVVLELKKLGDDKMVRDVSLQLHRGQILGLGGLVGAGRSETLELIFGSSGKRSGSIEFLGKSIAAARPLSSLRQGISYLPEDRRGQSIVPDMSVMENLCLTAMAQSRKHIVRREHLRAKIVELANRLAMPQQRLNDGDLLKFSGGMQQKILMMRCMLLQPQLLLLDEPTKGVDIAARAEIYKLLREISAEGVAVLLVSSDFEELLALSDSIVPISDGRSLGEIPATMLDEETLTLLAAPRSSTAGQAGILREISHRFDALTFWSVTNPNSTLCLLTSEEQQNVLPFAAGSVTPSDENPFARAMQKISRKPEKVEGRSFVAFPLCNQRGHDIGQIGISATSTETTLNAADIHNSLQQKLLAVFGRQIRIKD